MTAPVAPGAGHGALFTLSFEGRVLTHLPFPHRAATIMRY